MFSVLNLFGMRGGCGGGRGLFLHSFLVNVAVLAFFGHIRSFWNSLPPPLPLYASRPTQANPAATPMFTHMNTFSKCGQKRPAGTKEGERSMGSVELVRMSSLMVREGRSTLKNKIK